MSTYVLVVISPATTTSPVVISVSQATRPSGSSARTASRTESEIWSAILSGWPSVTDSEVKEKEWLDMPRRLPLDADPADVLCVAQCRRLELGVRRRAGVGEDRRLQPVLARVERRLHDASFGRGPDDEDALGRLGLEQQVERGVVEGGIAVLEQDAVAVLRQEPADHVAAGPVRRLPGEGGSVAVPAVAVVVDVDHRDAGRPRRGDRTRDCGAALPERG